MEFPRQQSPCATFGAGLTSACVVDIGAERTTVTCVDDGLMIAESRSVPSGFYFCFIDLLSFNDSLVQQ